MKSVTYVPASDSDKAIWLNNFSAKIPNYATLLGITAAEVTAVKNDATMYQYIVNMQEIFKQTLQNLTNYKTLLRHAKDQQHLPAAIPALPALGTAPASVPEGVFDRISKLARRIKASINYTDSIGSDLGIIAVSMPVDTSTMQPDLKASLDAGRPHLKWVKGHADAADLYVDRNDGAGFVYLGRMMRTEYIDIASLPAGKSIEEWTYRAIFVIADEPVGVYSKSVSIAVKKV